MSQQIAWTKIILSTFFEESGINDRIVLGDEKARILQGILRTRAAGWSIVKQAEEFNISVDTVNKYIKEIRKLYDATQKHSVILPVRKKSKKEEEMDRIKEENNKTKEEMDILI